MCRIATSCVLAMALLQPLATISVAEDLRGDGFITTLEGNAISGTSAGGLIFNLYFVPGGQVTYSNLAGMTANGTWHLDRDGDVCMRWLKPVYALEGCFRFSFNGDSVVWSSKATSGRGTLRGGVTNTFLKPGS